MKTKFTITLFVVFIISSKTSLIHAQIAVQDSLALVDLYNSTNGPGWLHNDNWLTGPVESWYGIFTGGERITAIVLNNNNLNGSIPPSLGDLTEIGSLYLEDNYLTDTIPASLGNLSLVSYFYLFNNQLSGKIPPSFGNLTLVGGLRLDNNQLSGHIPASLGNLSHLFDFSLAGNKLTGSIPSSFGNLSNLLDLFLDYNQLSGNIPSSLGNLSFLSELSLSNNKLSGNIPSSLGDIFNLSILDLSNNLLSGNMPPALGNHTITYLNLSNNQLSGSIPDLNLLFGLNLSNNQLSGNIPSSLSNLTVLDYLDLSDNKLSSKIPSSLGSLSFLSHLDLENNELTGSIPSSFGNLTSLNYLNLGNNELSENIPSSLGKLSSLAYLYLDSNQLSGSVPSSLGNVFFNSLYLQHNKLSGKVPFSLSHAVAAFLDLSNNQFTFAGMENIARAYPSAIYSPQANIALYKTENTLYVSAGGKPEHNTYNWYKGNLLDTTIYGDSTFAPDSNGNYSVSVNNSVATQLTLFSDTSSFVLPLTLLNFTATKNGKVNVLEWTTAMEINTSHFNIQRSPNGFEFTNIGIVHSTTVSNMTNNYKYIDHEPLSGENYYRLEIIDKDGYSEYSAIRAINVETIASRLYPNPTRDHITISVHSTASQAAQINIISLDGKVQKTMRVTLIRGYNNQVIELRDLLPATYIVIVASKHEILLSEKFIKE